MARQPEVASNVQTAMIISAALIEGVTFFALIVCLLSLFFKFGGEAKEPQAPLPVRFWDRHHV